MPGLFRYVRAKLLQRLEPVIDVLVNLVLGEAVALLQLAFELLAATLDDVEIVISEFAPFFLGRALELLPVAFNPVPIHRHPPLELRWDFNGQPIQTFREELRLHGDNQCSSDELNQPAALASRRRCVRMNSV